MAEISLLAALFTGITATTVAVANQPPPPTPVDCEGTWSNWGSCVNGVQSNVFSVTRQPLMEERPVQTH